MDAGTRRPFVWFQAVVWALLSSMAVLPALGRDTVDWPAFALWLSAWACGGVLVSSLIGATLTRLPDAWLRGARPALVVVPVGALGGLLWTLWLTAIEQGIGRDPLLPPHFPATRYFGMTFGRSLFLLVLWSALFLVNELSRRVQQSREQSARAQAAVNEAQLQLLRSQVNPHFLFNALNSVVALINENPRAAQTMVRDVSTLLRRALEADGRRDTTVQAELDFVQLYVKCEQVRFEERLQVHFDVAPDVLPLPTPPMLLHPLVENAVKHGLHQAGGAPLVVQVRARREGPALVFSVTHAGALTPPRGLLPQGSGIGLRNVRERLHAQFGDAGRCELTEAQGQVTATLSLPVKEG